LFHLVCERHCTTLTVPISADWQPKPGLSRQRFKGIDHPEHGKVAARSEASELLDDEEADRVDDVASLKRKSIRDTDADNDDDAGVGATDDNDDDDDGDDAAEWTLDNPPHRLRRAETILRKRTSSLIVVIDKAFDWHNINAIFRTCDALGVQHVWVIAPLEGYKGTADRNADVNRRINKSTDRWLTVRVFTTRKDCLAALRAEPDITIWACDVNDRAVKLDLPPVGNIVVPKRIALVMGHERTGVSRTMLAASDMHVYLPMFGFGSSLNLSVATALILQRVFDLAPHFHGQMSEAERRKLRLQWFETLAASPEHCKMRKRSR
jgi:tRNA (guanosine-2'-O-)-methyltransferase